MGSATSGDSKSPSLIRLPGCGSASKATVTQSDFGNYQVVVTGPSGSISSTVALLADPHPGNLIKDGDFESPLVADPINLYTYLQTGDTFGGVWVTEITAVVYGNHYSVFSQFPYHPTPAGHQFLVVGVNREDLADSLFAGTNYNLSFIQSGWVDVYYPSPAQ